MQPFNPPHQSISSNRPTVTGTISGEARSSEGTPSFDRIAKEIGVVLLVCLSLILIGAIFPRI